MRNLAMTSVQRSIGAIVVVLCLLIAGTWMVVKTTTDHLLDRGGTAAASGWASYLVGNVTDLEFIASGERPSSASMTFLEGARKAKQVFRYEIFNRQGYSQLIADHESIAPLDIAEFNSEAARSIESGQIVLEAREGTLADWPAYFARAFVPVFVEGRPIAIVAAYVDLTEQRDDVYWSFLLGATVLCLLTGLSFVVPAIAWYWGTKEKQQADRRIRFLAHHDALTGLDNRARLKEKLDAALLALPEYGPGLAVHFIDLDHFKEVNDTLGHDGGDFLLKTVSERLKAATSVDDVVARLGGDEFVVVQALAATEQDALDFATRLTIALGEKIQFNEQEITQTVSVGIALAPADGRTSERLLKSADLALYKSKADGRNSVRFFRAEMDVGLQARIELERAIRNAVKNDGFELHFQPLLEITDRRLIGFEALVRLPRADGTLIPPLTFIPVAEEIRVIDKIGAWVLLEACRTAATWPSHLTVAVNLSPAQFTAGSVYEVVAAALRETGLEPHRLELEITETLLLGDTESVLAELLKLKGLGVSIAMDDFGTGYSSLSYLWRFPFDKIKIDRSFMEGFEGTGREAETVVKTIIALGRELDMRVTVEGVETAKQVAFLDQANGDQVQGFFFGRPMPAADIAAAILKNATRHGPQQVKPLQSVPGGRA